VPPPQELDQLRERIERLEREVAELSAGMRNASASAPSLPSREIDDTRRSDPRL
jgi:tetrahydromethanopterin S-methyltransferase subunit B